MRLSAQRRSRGKRVATKRKADCTPEEWEAILAANRKWRSSPSGRQSVREAAKRYYARNKAKVREIQRRYEEKHRATKNVQSQLRLAAMSESEKEAKRAQWRVWYERNKHRWDEYRETRRAIRKRLGDLMEQQDLPRSAYNRYEDTQNA